MYSFNKHIVDQIKLAEKVASDLTITNSQNFVDFCFAGDEEKKIIKNEVEIPPNINNGFKPSNMEIPHGIFHPNGLLELDHISIRSTFSINHSRRKSRSTYLHGEFSAFQKKGILSNIKIKRGRKSEGNIKILNLLTQKLNNI